MGSLLMLPDRLVLRQLWGSRARVVFLLSVPGMLSVPAIGQTPKRSPETVRETARLASPVEPVSLWTGAESPPTLTSVRQLDNVRFSVIQPWTGVEPNETGSETAPSVSLAWLDDRLYCTFDYVKSSARQGGPVFRVSDDEGATWQDLPSVDSGNEANLTVTQGVLVTHERKLWAFYASYYDRREEIHTRVATWDLDSQSWSPLELALPHGFWPLQPPVRIENGNWVMAGMQVGGDPLGPGGDFAAVAISRGDDLRRWRFVLIPAPASLNFWGASALWTKGQHLLSLIPHGHPTRAHVASSIDGGATWSEFRPTLLAMAPSRSFAGRLETGEPFWIGHTVHDGENRRVPLTIAVGDRNTLSFNRLFAIRSALTDGPGESNIRVALSSPCAVEHQGKLYVAYTNSGGRSGHRNSIELAVISLDQL